MNFDQIKRNIALIDFLIYWLCCICYTLLLYYALPAMQFCKQ